MKIDKERFNCFFTFEEKGEANRLTTICDTNGKVSPGGSEVRSGSQNLLLYFKFCKQLAPLVFLKGMLV